jgi:hypothetical protein
MIKARPYDLEAGPEEQKIVLTIQEDVENPGECFRPIEIIQ